MPKIKIARKRQEPPSPGMSGKNLVSNVPVKADREAMPGDEWRISKEGRVELVQKHPFLRKLHAFMGIGNA